MLVFINKLQTAFIACLVVVLTLAIGFITYKVYTDPVSSRTYARSVLSSIKDFLLNGEGITNSANTPSTN